MPITVGQDTAKTRKTLTVGDHSIDYYSIPAATDAGLGDFSNLPAALKVVLENMLRFEDGKTVSVDDIQAFAEWGAKRRQEPPRDRLSPCPRADAGFHRRAGRGGPGRHARRDLVALGGDPEKINPLNPVDLVIDHSVMIDEFGNPRAFQMNVDREYERNMERYTFLKWGQSAFNNFRVVPPGTGICHQVNLEYLAQTVWTDTDQNGSRGGLSRHARRHRQPHHHGQRRRRSGLGRRRDRGRGRDAGPADLDADPRSHVGFKLTGAMIEGTTGTDLVLKVVEMLRAKGVVGKFVEFYGEGLGPPAAGRPRDHRQHGPGIRRHLRLLPDRRRNPALPAQHRPDEDRIALVEAYAKENGFWRGADYAPIYTDTLELDMGTIVPAISGPKRPQDYVALDGRQNRLPREMEETFKRPMGKEVAVAGEDYTMESGKVVIAVDHVLHQHLEPLCDDRRGPRGRKAAALGLEPQALGQRPRWHRARRSCPAYLEGRRPAERTSTRSASTSSAMAAPPASATPARMPERALQGDCRRAIWSRPRSCRATATSKAAISRMCAPTTSPRRRWSSPMRWPARHRHQI